jgi:ankyrin repeat protein
LESGADINAQDWNGSSALEWAIREREWDLPLISKLVSAGADPDLTNNMNKSPRDYAILQANSTELSKILSMPK